jgi:hypothetical protein
VRRLGRAEGNPDARPIPGARVRDEGIQAYFMDHGSQYLTDHFINQVRF